MIERFINIFIGTECSVFLILPILQTIGSFDQWARTKEREKERKQQKQRRTRSIAAEPWGDLFELIPIPLEPRGDGGGRTAGKGAVGEESEKEMKEKEETRWVGKGPVDILMQFARKVQEPRRSRNLSCLMLRRAKATEDRWRHCFQPPVPPSQDPPPPYV
ncbi:hypothetical protein KQX54_012033 [Cotesia glomerata]|uniref:Uncharacterized protein n=1 Tax=Cotesia glomerata TaxID=32391 RepID=A0AAV7ISF5_COTGL|nr:hypothetical protein KQX54_012033 [Cotesia glomerata]